MNVTNSFMEQYTLPTDTNVILRVSVITDAGECLPRSNVWPETPTHTLDKVLTTVVQKSPSQMFSTCQPWTPTSLMKSWNPTSKTGSVKNFPPDLLMVFTAADILSLLTTVSKGLPTWPRSEDEGTHASYSRVVDQQGHKRIMMWPDVRGLTRFSVLDFQVVLVDIENITTWIDVSCLILNKIYKGGKLYNRLRKSCRLLSSDLQWRHVFLNLLCSMNSFFVDIENITPVFIIKQISASCCNFMQLGKWVFLSRTVGCSPSSFRQMVGSVSTGGTGVTSNHEEAHGSSDSVFNSLVWVLQNQWLFLWVSTHMILHFYHSSFFLF